MLEGKRFEPSKSVIKYSNTQVFKRSLDIKKEAILKIKKVFQDKFRS
jgi:hypothetical protein